MKEKRTMLARAARKAKRTLFPVQAVAVSPVLQRQLADVDELRKKQQFAEAITRLEALEKQFPKIAEVYIAFADVYFDMRMKRKSQQMLAKAVQLGGAAAPEYAKRLAHQVLKQAKTPVRDSIAEIMMFVRELGFVPGTIIDVGVNKGTPGLFDFFPKANLLMVDPIAENEMFMKHIASLYPNSHYELCAATGQPGWVTMNVTPDFGGSSVADSVGLKQQFESRKVEAKTLDSIIAQKKYKGPYVIKVDTEGTELDVLEGAKTLLAEAELLILEVRIRTYPQIPDLYAVMSELEKWGFVAYDFIDRNYHDVEGTLKQCDIVAVRRNGFFRTPDAYRKLTPGKVGVMEEIMSKKISSRAAALENIAG